MRVATRQSALARWQAERVVELLGARGGVEAELVLVETTGDRRTDVPLHSIGGTGVFVKEVQEAVLDGRADVAVHSAKDLPAITPDGLVLAAIPERADVRDALVGSTLDALPTGGIVATGSVRRRAQLAALRPDLGFAELRGNMHTRLEKASRYDAIVVAAAALDRLGLADRIAERLEPSVMLPQVAQGALAVECRADDADTLALVAAIEDAAVRRPIDAERAFLAELGGGCSLPVGAHASVAADSAIRIVGLLATPDGRSVVRATDTDTDAETAGRRVAATLRAMFDGDAFDGDALDADASGDVR
jgi:hydroxymethylbilane synthase